mgnify:CR=1 FL=1
MPSAINWIVPQRVLLTSLNGDMSKEDFVNFMTEIRAQIAQGQKPVYLESAVKPLPSGMGYKASVLCFFC